MGGDGNRSEQVLPRQRSWQRSGGQGWGGAPKSILLSLTPRAALSNLQMSNLQRATVIGGAGRAPLADQSPGTMPPRGHPVFGRHQPPRARGRAGTWEGAEGRGVGAQRLIAHARHQLQAEDLLQQPGRSSGTAAGPLQVHPAAMHRPEMAETPVSTEPDPRDPRRSAAPSTPSAAGPLPPTRRRR